MTMVIDTKALAILAQKVAETMRACEQELNAADARLGDGDTGVTMRRVFEKLAEASANPQEDIGAFFRKAGMAAAGATGSSLGTLVAVSLMAIGKENEGRTTIEAADIGGFLRVALKTMITRGGANLGDKSVLDAIDAVAAALENTDGGDLGAAALQATRSTLERFRGEPCRIGRARMFSERSVGLDDPGMLAFTRLVEGSFSGAAASAA
jgi:dihydroxyacetone kinase